MRQIKMNADAVRKEPRLCAPAVSKHTAGYGYDFRRAENNDVGGHIQLPLFADWNELSHPGTEAAWIAALNEHRAWPSEPAHKTFPRRETGHPS